MSAGGVIAVATISLTDRLRDVRDLLVTRAIMVTDRIYLGSQYLNIETDGLRLVFVPTGLTPSTGPLEMSNKEGGANQWECTAHLWATNHDDDYGFAQFAALESLLTELQGALRLVAGGRFRMGNIAFADATHVLKYGESATFPFSFQVNFQMVPDTQALPAGQTKPTAAPRAIT